MNDSGINGTTVDVAASDTQSFYANINLNPDGSFTYTPTIPWSGIDQFQYAIKDGDGHTDSATVTININPIVKNDSYAVFANHRLTIGAPGVLANDAGGDPFTLGFDATSVHHGAVFDDGNGSFDYTPPHGFAGVDTFHYRVQNLDHTKSYTGTVTITVKPVTPPPPPKPTGYWMVGGTGIVYAFGQVRSYGNAPTTTPRPTSSPRRAARATGCSTRTGHVFAFGDAHVYGRAPNLRPGRSRREPVVHPHRQRLLDLHRPRACRSPVATRSRTAT